MVMVDSTAASLKEEMGPPRLRLCVLSKSCIFHIGSEWVLSLASRAFFRVSCESPCHSFSATVSILFSAIEVQVKLDGSVHLNSY